MKIVGVVFFLLALGAIVVLALWPREDSAAKRRDLDDGPLDQLTRGVISGSGGEKPVHGHHGHHGDQGGGHDGGDSGSGHAGGHGH